MKDFICLLVDDDLDDREIFQAVLETIRPNSSCQTAPNGRVALQLMEKREVIPDLVFLDLNMPLMNGRQFLYEIKRKNIFQHVPIIVLTTSSDSATKTDVLELGAKEFYTKPDKFSDWEKIISDVIVKFIN